MVCIVIALIWLSPNDLFAIVLYHVRTAIYFRHSLLGMLSSVESSSSSHPESTEVNLLDASSLPWTVPSLQVRY